MLCAVYIKNVDFSIKTLNSITYYLLSDFRKISKLHIEQGNISGIPIPCYYRTCQYLNTVRVIIRMK